MSANFIAFLISGRYRGGLRQCCASTSIRFTGDWACPNSLSILRGSSAALLIGYLAGGNAVIVEYGREWPIMLVYAVVSVAAGLAMVLGDNFWSGADQLLERMQYVKHYSL
jgi:hypothetical protein